VGTGILLKKKESDAGVGWSAPVACGLTGVGWGMLVGGSIKDLMIFVFDEATVDKIGFDKTGLELGAQVRKQCAGFSYSAFNLCFYRLQ